MIKGSHHNKETRERISSSLKNHPEHYSKERNQKISLFMTNNNPMKRLDVRKRVSETKKEKFRKGLTLKPVGMKNKHHTEEWKANLSKRMLGKKLPKASETKKRLYREGKLKPIKGMLGKHHTKANRDKFRITRLGKNNPFYGKHHTSKNLEIIRERANEHWKDKEYSEKTLNATFKKLRERPTSYEKKISELCIENKLPFVYTGNGTFLIGFKNPDFVDKEQKIAIEVYHNFWKIRDFGSCENYEKQRSEYFTKYGWKTIFIGTEEMENENWKDICLNKIKDFVRGETNAR